jgi:hypothetical protein
MGCHFINSAYLCERHGIMRRELNSTCLGLLYVQDFPGTMTLCEMRIVEQTKTVLQLQDYWYLVYLPAAFTSYIICLNNSNSEVFVKIGPNRIYISPSCQMCLKDHVLISDFSLRLDSIIKHYEWDLDEIAFSPEDCSLSLRVGLKFCAPKMWVALLSTPFAKILPSKDAHPPGYTSSPSWVSSSRPSSPSLAFTSCGFGT